MATGGEFTDLEADERQTILRRFRELFHGRFNDNQSTILMKTYGWDIQKAVINVLNAKSEDIAQLLGDNKTKRIHEFVTKDNVIRELAIKNEIKASVRMFACQACNHTWWRRAPERKPVSKCRKCLKTYEAIPRDQEWGLAEFECSCGNKFLGKGAMGRTSSECYSCHQMCDPARILPPFKSKRQRRNIPHSCSGGNCYNHSGPRNRQTTDECVHPKSNPRKILVASKVHVSTGSTVATFLDQDDLDSLAFQSDLDSIPESDDNM